MNVRPYEMLVLASAELEDPKEEIAKVEEVVRSLGGEVSKTDFWGKGGLPIPSRKKRKVFTQYAILRSTPTSSLN